MTPFARAALALRLLALDPSGLGGMVLRARPGPARDALVAALPGGHMRLSPALPPEALTGGMDVAQSLAAGSIVRHRGLLAGKNRLFLLPMAERLPPTLCAPLCAALDAGRGHRIVALDEGCDEDEAVPAPLADRLAFHVDFERLGRHDVERLPRRSGKVSPHGVALADTAVAELATLAVTLGITSLRAPSLALRAARTHAAFRGRGALNPDDLLVAAELVLAPRATRLPADSPEEPNAPEQERADTSEQNPDPLQVPEDILLAAIKTALPRGLLENSRATPAKSGQGSGAGRKRTGNRRGRPLPARNGAVQGSQPRIDLVATLRAAVPWQRLRRAEMPDRTGPIIRPSDLRYRRFEELSDRLLVFAVDASGSAALARLAEAKGAVELLLGEAYARRDHVALIAFRGTTADVLLTPTRSLVQTKRRLADLPGGGGTPLAAGLKVGLETVLPALRRGLTPLLVILTDGRGNVALDGTADRARAATDATTIARQIAEAGIDSVVIDTGRRPEPGLRDLALSLLGRHVALPRADARALATAVTDAAG